MKITKLESCVKDTVKLFVDNKYICSISFDDILEFKLKKGLDICEKDLANLKERENERGAYLKALSYILIRPRSVLELRNYLEGKGYLSEIIEKNIIKLKEKKYLDDEKFAEQWVEAKGKKYHRSAFALLHELKEKGVKEEIIECALSSFDENKIAKALIDKKMKSWNKLDKAALKHKIFSYLQGRSFSFDTIYNVLEKIIE